MPGLDYNVERIVAGELLAHHVIYLIGRGAEAIQEEHGLVVDGKAGPATRAAIDALLGLAPPTSPIPKGKGMFVRSLGPVGTPATMIQQMNAHGLSWAIIQRIWQYEDKASKLYNTTSLKNHAAALLGAGHEVWLWGFPTPGKHDEFVQELVGAAIDVKARGVIIDPEKPFIGRPDAAIALMNAIKPLAEKYNLGLGFTSYGAPWNVPTFPWKAFTGAGFGMPQIYDAENNLPKTYPAQSIASWSALGFQRIVPVSAAFAKTKAQMAAMLAATPAKGAICWWDWYNCLQSAERWDAIGGYTLAG